MVFRRASFKLWLSHFSLDLPKRWSSRVTRRPIAYRAGGVKSRAARQAETTREPVNPGPYQAPDKPLDAIPDFAVFQALGVPLVVSDLDYRILQVNPAARSLLHAGEAALTGQSLLEWVQAMPPGARESLHLSPVSVIGVGGEGDLVLPARFLLKNRPGTTIEMVTTPVRVDGRPVGHAHLLYDITAQIQSMLAREEFLINVAHELRAPLAALRASIELLLEDYRSMTARELGVMLRSMHKASIKFQTLIESLTEAESIRAGKFLVNPSPTPLDEILHDAIAQTTALLRSRAQTLELLQQGATGLVVMADRPRILQVIINLITNASKYGPEEQPIILSVCQSDGFAHIGVTDSGPGIPAEEQQEIFLRFYRSKKHEQNGSGIGLGLGIVREIVHAHGGVVHLVSEPGKGTTFWFSLRQANAQGADDCPAANEAAS